MLFEPIGKIENLNVRIPHQKGIQKGTIHKN